MKAKDIRSELSALLKAARDNVDKAIDNATESQYASGMVWYQHAHDDCLYRADHYRISIEQFAGMVAALSPQMRWEWNILEAEKMCVDPSYKPGTYGLCVKKARDIYNGCDPVETLRGPKTTAFYHCIVDPGGSWRVAIDRHQIRLMFPEGSKRMHSTMLDLFYQELEEVHGLVADKRKMLPSQAQAIGWIVQREGS